MSNTYADNPARGLSKLQKAILVYLWESQERMLNSDCGYAPPGYMVSGDGPGIPWRKRPTFYGKPLFGGNFWYGETPAVSRSLKRLEERGLIFRTRPIWYHYGKRTLNVRLTCAGMITSKRLAAEYTSKYKNKRSEAMRSLYMLSRGDKPCSVCGGAIDKEGHCFTEGCINFQGATTHE